MIQTSRQLKALVRNLSKGDSNKAQIIIRNYVMERFLERLSLSPYKNNLILKGGTLVSAMVGLDNRSTMDVDATIKNLTLSVESAQKIVEEISSIWIEDGMTFEIKSVYAIMDEADYPGVRIMLDTTLETMHPQLKIDLSTGDIIIEQYLSENICPSPYICPDEIVKRARKFGDYKSEYDLYIDAMKSAEDIRIQYVKHGESFTFETVFSNMEKLKFLRFAKAYGFYIVVIYITTANPSINVRRVRFRVKEGGHDVPEEKIRTRYQRCMSLMAEVVSFADEAEVYDNSIDGVAPKMVFKKYRNGVMHVKNDVNWVADYLRRPLLNMGYVLNLSE